MSELKERNTVQNQETPPVKYEGHALREILDKPLGKVAVIGASAVAALGLVFGGLKAAEGISANENIKSDTSNSEELPVNEAPVVDPDVEVEDSPEAPSVDVTKIPADVVEYNLFETLTPAEQSEIVSMKNMDLLTFRNLPVTEQAKFGQFIFDNNIDVLKYRLDQTDNSFVYEKANLETPEGIYYTSILKGSLLSSLKSLTPAGGVQFDVLTALKANSILIDTTADPIVTSNIDANISTWNVNTPPIMQLPVFKGGSQLEDGSFITNFTTEKNGNVQSVFSVHEVQLIDGTTKLDARQDLSISEADPRYNPSLAN